MTVYANPEYFKGTPLKRKKLRAKDGDTWQAGQFGRRTDSGTVPCLSNATSIQFMFAETQATATSSSDVWVDEISAGTQLKIYCTSGSADTRALVSYIGSNEGLAVNSCICTLSTGNDSNEVLHVEDIYANVESFSADTSDLPGIAIVTIPAAVLTAEGLNM